MNAIYEWGEVDGKELTERVEQIYEKIVHWKRNLFYYHYQKQVDHF